MGLRDRYKTEANAEISGIEYETEGCVFVLARAGGANKRYTRIVEKLTEPYRRQIQKGILDREIQDRIVRQAFAQAVVKRWEGVTYADLGEVPSGANPTDEAPFTADNCTKLFTELPELFIDLQEVATDAAAYREITMEEDAKN